MSIRLQPEIAWEYLTENQRKFCEAWVRTHNFTASLKEADYAFDESNPNRLGRRLLRRCKSYVDYLETQALRTQLVSISAVQLQLTRLGFSNLLNYFVPEPDGRMRPKAIEELTRDEAAAVKEWTYGFWDTGKKDASGNAIMRTVLGEIKLHDTRGPLQDLMKSLGGFPQKAGESLPTAGAGPANRFSDLPPTEAIRLDAALKHALRVLDRQRDAGAIESRGADGAHQGDEPGQARTRALPPPASTKG